MIDSALLLVYNYCNMNKKNDIVNQVSLLCRGSLLRHCKKSFYNFIETNFVYQSVSWIPDRSKRNKIISFLSLLTTFSIIGAAHYMFLTQALNQSTIAKLSVSNSLIHSVCIDEEKSSQNVTKRSCRQVKSRLASRVSSQT